MELILLLIIIQTFSTFHVDTADVSSSITCPYANNRKFDVGDTWYKVLPTADDTFCVTCECTESGKSRCESRSCYKSDNSCAMAKSLTAMEKECCSKCDDPPFASKIASSSSRCIYKGKTYSDGQHFAANSTSLMAVESNQCVQCTCKGSPQSQSSADQDGLVMCRVKTCLVDTCDQLKDTKESDQDCCSSLPLCQGRKAVKEEEVNKELTVTFLGEANVGHSGKQGKSGPSKGCQSGGRLYRDGASWHPVIGPLGQMDCVRCRCESPDIKCSRIRCKTLEQGNCPKGHQWRRVTGSCCPVCRKAATSHVFNASSTTIQSMSPLASDWSSVCVPAQYDFLVYKSLISRNFEQFYQFAFISTTDGISLYSWTLKTEHTDKLTVKNLSASDYRELSSSVRFELKGATRSKFVGKFATKATVLLNGCQVRCIQKINRLERTLRLKEAIKGRPCASNETVFA